MGGALCRSLKVIDEQSITSQRIEFELKNEMMEMKKLVKILLLGGSDSGKSTIVKQMR